MPFRGGPPRITEARETRWLAEPNRVATAAPGHAPRGPALPFAGGREATVAPEDIDLSMVPIERYADMVARLSRGESRESVLRSAILTEQVWNAIQRAWGRRLKDDKTLALRFNQLLQKGLKGQGPSR